MNYKKLVTSKANCPVVFLTDEKVYIVKNEKGFAVFNFTGTKELPETSPLLKFDESEHINYYNEWKERKEKERQEAEELARQTEIQRIEKLKAEILNCESPLELAEYFDLGTVETANHWNELYTGKSRMAILINDRKDYEILKLAVEIHGAEGEFGECKNRAGEHHHTFNSYYDLEDYQERCKTHFNGNNYFFKSRETEAEFYTETLIKETILEDEDLTADEKMEEIKKAVAEWEEIEEGYYDCNGNLEMLESTLNDADLTGYSEDVYTYRFAFKCEFKNKWKAAVEEDEDEDE